MFAKFFAVVIFRGFYVVLFRENICFCYIYVKLRKLNNMCVISKVIYKEISRNFYQLKLNESLLSSDDASDVKFFRV